MAAGAKIICETNNIDYITIRKTMINGARTIEDIQEQVPVCGECEGCKANLDRMVEILCGCTQATMQSVIDAVQAGADTVEKVVEQTGAGSGCGRCQALIANVVELGR